MFKQLLVNSPPKVLIGYKVIELALLRDASVDLSTMFEDPNPGDKLDFSISPSDLQDLYFRNLFFEVLAGLPKIIGKPNLPGVIGMVKVTAYD